MNKSKIHFHILILIVLCMSLSGCTRAQGAQMIPVPRDIYQREDYQSVEVKKGDLKPVLSLSLIPSEVESVNESVNLNDLHVKEIFVSLGQQVNAGDPLISFNSEDIEKEIRSLESTVEEKELQLNHYLRLYTEDFDKHDEKYSVKIEELKDELEIARSYLNEEQERYQSNQLYASKGGVISYISRNVLGGYAKPGDTLVTIESGGDVFYAIVDSQEPLNVGDSFTATQGNMEIPVEITEIVSESDKSNRVIFKPIVSGDISFGNARMDVEISKTEYHDALYIPRKAVNSSGDDFFVYVVKENGFLDIRPIKIGEEVDDMVIVKEGLAESERVTIRQ